MPPLPRYGANGGRHRTGEIVIGSMVHETEVARWPVTVFRQKQAAGGSVARRVQGIVNKNNRTLRSWLRDATVVGTAPGRDATEHDDEDVPFHASVVPRTHTVRSRRH